MNKHKREQQRLKDEGKVFTPKRNPPIPSPKVIPLKHKERKIQEIEHSWDDER